MRENRLYGSEGGASGSTGLPYPYLWTPGVSGWPRLFHSMRASRQTELQREFPLHVVCSWLGNSPRIAQQSYLLVTVDDFAKAAGAKKVLVSLPKSETTPRTKPIAWRSC